MAWNNKRKGKKVTRDFIAGSEAQKKKERTAKERAMRGKTTKHREGDDAMPETVVVTMPVTLGIEVVVFGGKVRVVGLRSSTVSLADVVEHMPRREWDRLCAKYRVPGHELPLNASEVKAVETLLSMLDGKDEGPMPTVRSIMSRLGVKSTSYVHRTLKSLEDKGYIEVTDKGGVRWLDIVLKLKKKRT